MISYSSSRETNENGRTLPTSYATSSSAFDAGGDKEYMTAVLDVAREKSNVVERNFPDDDVSREDDSCRDEESLLVEDFSMKSSADVDGVSRQNSSAGTCYTLLLSPKYRGLWIAVVYGVISALAVLANKNVLSARPIGYGFSNPNTVLLLQSLVAVFIVYVLRDLPIQLSPASSASSGSPAAPPVRFSPPADENSSRSKIGSSAEISEPPHGLPRNRVHSPSSIIDTLPYHRLNAHPSENHSMVVSSSSTLSACDENRNKNGGSEDRLLPTPTYAKLFQCLPLALSSFLTVLLGLPALAYLTVPMYTLLKRTNTILLVPLERIFLAKKVSYTVLFSLFLMVLGGSLASMTDMYFHALGYFFAIASAVVQAMSFIMTKRSGETLNLTEIVFYNALWTIPFSGILIFVMDEASALASYPLIFDMGFWFALAASALIGLLLNAAQFLNVTFNSPLTNSVTGHVKNMFTTVIGYFIFEKIIFDILNTLGICIAALGAAVYSWSKMKEQRDKIVVNQKLGRELELVEFDSSENHDPLSSSSTLSYSLSHSGSSLPSPSSSSSLTFST